MVRGRDRSELRLPSPIQRVTTSRETTYGVTGGGHGSHTRDKKKWLRVLRPSCPASQFQVGDGGSSVQIRDDNEDYAETVPEGAVGESWEPRVSLSQQCSGLVRYEVGGIKRGGETSSMDLVSSPQKKIRGTNSEADRQMRYDGSLDVCELWGHVEAVSGETEGCVLTVGAGNLARGGGGWPSTAARSP
ncbi:hypothetical protein ACFXTH_044456 [Malus domestica]